MKTLKIFCAIAFFFLMISACTDDGGSDFAPEAKKYKNLENPTAGTTLDPDLVPVYDRDRVIIIHKVFTNFDHLAPDVRNRLDKLIVRCAVGTSNDREFIECLKAIADSFEEPGLATEEDTDAILDSVKASRLK